MIEAVIDASALLAFNKLPIYTAKRIWKKINIDVPITLIR